MKAFQMLLLLFVFIGVLFFGCSDSPVSSVDQPASLDKKGPIIHAAQGSFHLWYEGKHIAETISAHMYQDGTVDGTYLMNAQNALSSKTQKWNGNVLFLQTYDNFGQYNGTMAVIGGVQTTGSYAGWYDTFFVIDNSPNGTDETSYYVWVTPDFTEAQSLWNLAPEDLIAYLYGILQVEGGSLRVY